MGKNLLKKTNNAIIHALFRHSANNRRFFRNFDQHLFFFSFEFGVLLIVTKHIQTAKVKLLKKCLFVFITLYTKK